MFVTLGGASDGMGARLQRPLGPRIGDPLERSITPERRAGSAGDGVTGGGEPGIEADIG